MTYEQKGKYIVLLCLQHQQGFLTYKDMINICSTYDEDIFIKFVKEGDLYYNRRMKEESDRRKKYSESRSENRKNISSSYDKHMETETETININKKEIKVFTRPEIEEIRAYCQERGNNVNPETFFNFYESKGWLIGKSKMKNWKAAVRTWENNDYRKQDKKLSCEVD